MCPPIKNTSNTIPRYPASVPDYNENTKLIHNSSNKLNHDVDSFIQLIENSKRKMERQNRPRNIINIIHEALTALYHIITFQREKNVSLDKNIFNEHNIYLSGSYVKNFSGRELELIPYYKEFNDVILGRKDTGIIYFDESNTDHLEINVRYVDINCFIDIRIVDKNEVKQNITTIDVGQSGLFHDFNGKIAHLYDDHYFTEDSSPNNLEDIKNSDFNGKLYGGDDFEGVTIKRSDFKKDPHGEYDFEGVTIKRSDFKKDPLGEYDFEGVMIKRSDFKKDPHGEDDFEREHCGNVINHDDYKPNNITDIITNNILDELKIKCKKISEKNKSVDFLFKVIDDILPNNIVGRYILYEIICTGSQRYRHMTTEMDKIFSEVNNVMSYNVVSYHLSNHIAHPRLNKQGIENIEQLLLKNQISKKDKNQVLFELSQVFITLSSSLYLGNEDLSVTPLRMYAAALLNYAFKNYSRGESLDTNSLQNKMSGYYDRSLRSDCCAQVLSRDMKINIRELDKVFFELPESFYPETWWHNNL